jgi:hypothetical protein
MRKKIGVLILAGTFAVTALPHVALAAQGGKMSGQTQQLKTQQQIKSQQRLRDGSGAGNAGSGTMQKKGNAYGPGDGTGNAGTGPKDGSGYGAPSNR